MGQNPRTKRQTLLIPKEFVMRGNLAKQVTAAVKKPKGFLGPGNLRS